MTKAKNKRSGSISAFTIVEIMVVVSIILVLMALSGSVYTSVKRSAKEATVLSNLRQCSAAVLIYESDNEGYPTMQETRNVLAKAPTCDPEDYWNPGCKQASSDPLIGSFAYAGGVTGMETPQEINEYLGKNGARMFVSIFHSDNKIDKFLGDQPSNINQCILKKTCNFPNKIIDVRNDGSAKSRHFTTSAVISTTTYSLVMTWTNVFSIGVKNE